jgi:predicted amidophosphoribosyltransferase
VTFLYEIYSAVNGCGPCELSQRLRAGNRLELRWPVGLAGVHSGTEVSIGLGRSRRWVEGVFFRGSVDWVDAARNRLHLRVRERSAERPLAGIYASGACIGTASQHEHLFLVAEDRAVIRVRAALASAAATHRCSCTLPLVDSNELAWPPRLPRQLEDFVPAFWVLPTPSHLYAAPRPLRHDIRVASDLCLRFKFGEEALARPLALAMREALARRGFVSFDCVAPVPLSPQKQATGAIHRTRLLAVELACLLGTEVVELLALAGSVSASFLRRAQGLSTADAEAAYAAMLHVDARAQVMDRVLVVDDLCNEGSTLAAVVDRLRHANRQVRVVAVTAGQLALTGVVRDESMLFA